MFVREGVCVPTCGDGFVYVRCISVCAVEVSFEPPKFGGISFVCDCVLLTSQHHRHNHQNLTTKTVNTQT